MRLGRWIVPLAVVMQGACGALQTGCGQDANDAANGSGTVDEATLFHPPGFQREGAHWGKCGDPATPGYEPGAIDRQGDFSGDGRPAAIVTEGSSACFGMTGSGYTLISQQADRTWAILSEETGGALRLLETSGAGRWPDIEIGVPPSASPSTAGTAENPTSTEWDMKGSPASAEAASISPPRG